MSLAAELQSLDPDKYVPDRHKFLVHYKISDSLEKKILYSNWVLIKNTATWHYL